MVVDGLPGWTKEAFNALKEKNQQGLFIVVALNGYWKLLIGYFLIDSLNGKERANLLEIY